MVKPTKHKKKDKREHWTLVTIWAPAILLSGDLLDLAHRWGFTQFTDWATRTLDHIDVFFSWLQTLLLDSWVPSFVSWISGLVPWHLTLPADWRNLFTLLIVYLWAHVREAFAANVPRPWQAFLLRLISAITGLILGTVSAVLMAAGGYDRVVVAILSSAVGIAVYRLGFAAQFAYDRSVGPHRLSFASEFRRKAVGVLAVVVGAAAISALVTVTKNHGMRVRDFLWILAVVYCLGAFHIRLAWVNPATTGNRNIGKRLLLAATVTVLLLIGASAELREIVGTGLDHF